MLTRLVKSLLYGLQAADRSSMVGAILLMIVGLAASWIPARLAAGVQPMEALRHDKGGYGVGNAEFANFARLVCYHSKRRTTSAPSESALRGRATAGPKGSMSDFA